MANNKNKLVLIFDGNIFAHEFIKNSSRSGIFFVALNLIKEFAQIDNIEINLYYNYRNYHKLKTLLEQNKLPNKCRLTTKDYKYNLLNKVFIRALDYSIPLNKDNTIKKALRYLIYRFLRIKNMTNINSLQNSDIYFSACDKIPDEILNNPKIKSYQLLHDVIPIVMKKEYKGFNSPLLWMQDLVNSLNNNNTYFTVSEHTKKDFIKCAPWMNEKNFIVSHLGANDKFYRELDINKILKVKEKYKIPINKKYVFSLCTLEPRKNILFAVKSFLQFIKQNNIKDTVIALGGASWKEFMPVLEKELNNLSDYKDSIIKLGYVEDEDLSILYSGAEVFVYPSLYEGFGLPILEAMQCGCPVICSNRTSIPEVIGNAGIQIDPTSESEMIDSLEKFYFNDLYRKECINKGIERAKEFSWNKCAKIMIEKFYKDII